MKGRGLDGLWAIAGVAPMFGLFGTVWGIAGAFQKISSFGLSETGERITQLAGGINVALYSTIVGLVIGILSLLFYYIVKAKLDSTKTTWYGRILNITNKL